MKKLIIILFTILSTSVYGQQYYWDFAMSTGICPTAPRTYPFEYNDIEFLNPIKMTYDLEGNTYVMGVFKPGSNYETFYHISPTVKIESCQGCQTVALYIYKISNSGKLVWANTISHDVNPVGDLSTNVDFTVNPFSGKVYITHNVLDYIYVNQDKFTLQFDNSKGTIKRMMMCFNADGSYNKTIGNVFEIRLPHFSSVEKGVYIGSKISEFYPWNDSASFYLLDAVKDSVTSTKYANVDKILYFDSKKQRYITEQLGEYDVNLVKTKNNVYNHQHNYFGGKILNYFSDKNGSHYFFYHNTNVGQNYEYRYYLQKLDSNFKRIWVQSSWDPVQIQKDTNDNIWILVQSNSIYVNEVSSGLKKYPVVYNNPSDCYLIRLNSSNGDLTNNKIVPTNLIQQSNAIGLFKINKQNEFWMAGYLYNEAEFGDYKLSMNCNGNFIPLQHYLAKAKEGWKQDRKNLATNSIQNQFGIEVFPNPNHGLMTLNNPNNLPFQSIELFDILGNTQLLDIDKSNQTINIEDLNQGVYILKISLNHQELIYKIIKQ